MPDPLSEKKLRPVECDKKYRKRLALSGPHIYVLYTEYNVDRLKEDSPEQYSPVVNGLVYMTRQTTMPQIFICGKFVGGFTDLQKLKESHKLLDAIMECTGENAPHE
ncbi:unnamed protein product [Nippostrongylus brasiliensis]|uniref:Glutaredoxin domain-containing protein n=1 Tax=Nippostrongylus brasiliensis TaxID=27835 RepID=A0A0N4Y7S3_NIPBR|nr:unnamed protein product [Nippostrongylus brasiliensis]